MFKELRGRDPVARANMTIKPPFLRENCLTANISALIAPFFFRFAFVRTGNFLRSLQDLEIGVDGLLVGGPDVDPQVGLVKKYLALHKNI